MRAAQRILVGAYRGRQEDYFHPLLGTGCGRLYQQAVEEKEERQRGLERRTRRRTRRAR